MIVKSRKPSGGEKLREDGKHTKSKPIRKDVHTKGGGAAQSIAREE